MTDRSIATCALGAYVVGVLVLLPPGLYLLMIGGVLAAVAGLVLGFYLRRFAKSGI